MQGAAATTSAPTRVNPARAITVKSREGHDGSPQDLFSCGPQWAFLSVSGYFEENFLQFRWDFTSKILAFDATLHGQDVNNVVIADCAGVSGSATPLP